MTAGVSCYPELVILTLRLGTFDKPSLAQDCASRRH